MTQRLVNQVAVITGAAGGIGRASALRFAKEGLKGLLLADVDEKGLLETSKLLLKETNIKPVVLKTDVSKEAEVKKMISTAEKEFGKVTVVFNNAGIMHSDDDFVTSEKVWDLTMVRSS